MKILMAQDTFLPKIGGAEVHVWKLSKALITRGHQITIVTTIPGSSWVDGLRVYRFPQLRSGGKRAVATLPLYLPQLLWLIMNSEIVHGHYTAFCSAITGTIARILKRPFIVTLHGYGTLDSSVQGNFWLQYWRRIAFHSANKVIATSSELADVARRFVSNECIIVIPNGVDTSEFTPSSDTLPTSFVRIATVRRLVPKNGVQYLLEAMPLILRQSPKPVELWIIGDGPLRQYLETRAKELGVDTKVRFWGAIPNEQVKDILKQVQLVVFPSSAESTSIAALEAMAMGKTIIASAVGGYLQLIGENERGLLVRLFDRTVSDYNAPLTLPLKSLQTLSEAVVRLIREPDLAKELGEKGRMYVQQNFDWCIIAKQIEQIYVEVKDKCCVTKRVPNNNVETNLPF